MKSAIKKLIKLVRYEGTKKHEWFTGNYSTYEEARSRCTGYDAPTILEKVKNSLLKVKNGEAVYERDSVLFDRVEYSLPLLAFLLYAASASGNKLNILDLGGSLGSTYYQNKKFLNKLASIQWSIVEQPHFVDCGKAYFTDDSLAFFESIDECLTAREPNAILLSSVLPYLPLPYATVQEVINYGFEFIIIDRTPFFKENVPDRLTIEHVPSEIYEAEYPAWFFNYEKFLAHFKPSYKLFEIFPANDTQTLQGSPTEYMAMLFVRNRNE